MNAIDPKDIRVGDTVRVTRASNGITFSWEGKIETITADRVRLNAVSSFAFDGDYTWELLNRPVGKYGPQTAEIEVLIERAKTLTDTEVESLDAAWDAARDTARDTAWDTAWGAALGAAWGAARDTAWATAWATALGAAWDAARDTAWATAWDAARDAARVAARVAAWALVVRDLIGQCGFTQAHYDRLTEPWAKVIGKVHPDDADRMPDPPPCTNPTGDPAKRCDCDARPTMSRPDDADRPTPRMAEPTNIGAQVIDAHGDSFIRWSTDPEITTQWMRVGSTDPEYRWEWITNPTPGPGCILTADDPEPPNWSVVLGVGRVAWQRNDGYWVEAGAESYYRWDRLGFPVTLLHVGGQS